MHAYMSSGLHVQGMQGRMYGCHTNAQAAVPCPSTEKHIQGKDPNIKHASLGALALAGGVEGVVCWLRFQRKAKG